ncbi:MAG: hypothetical protein ACLGHZ_08325 [Actinomycetes bacterium]
MDRESGVALGALEGDRTAGVAGYTAAGLGVVAAAALAVMFAVEKPRGGPYVFGAVNDFTGGLYYAATIPVIVQIHRRLPDGPASRTALAAVVTGSAAASASGVLLSLHLIPFVPSTAVSIVGIVGQAVWTTATHHQLLDHGTYPRDLARAGRAIGLGMLAALPLVGGGLAAGAAPELQRALYGIGGALGGAAYLSWPLWFAAAGRRLRDSPVG